MAYYAQPAAPAAAAPAGPPDYEVQNVQDDTISSLAWSPNANLLCAASWNNDVRVWEMNQSGIVPRAALQPAHTGPVLAASWMPDGTGILTASADKMAKLWNLSTNQAQQIAAHDGPIRDVEFFPDQRVFITTSWDRTLRVWNGQQGTPVNRVQLPERVWCCHSRGVYLAIACADKNIYSFDMRNLAQPFRTDASKDNQTTVVKIFPDQTGLTHASNDGRVSILWYQENPAIGRKNFAFKCHRDVTKKEVHGINDICFHPTFGTFVTAGGDCSYIFWDHISQQRLAKPAKKTTPVTAVAFNNSGQYLAYALGYDWERGFDGNTPEKRTQIFLHQVTEDEVKPKPKAPGT
ncbi:putative Protein RAE1 [Paratrimastix pyriformis]|uniref:Uncharacterized protein n=1 Tax=Paratrimastix pyriformis TaxID=342808 RepID=A0ABQ8UEH8_9EUKA|nr:putative Protein RAE1 [Paratrimastix pyriformis]